jgi:hypothetical protein
MRRYYLRPIELLMLFSCTGCYTYSKQQRIEQVAQVGDSVKIIVSSGIMAHSTEGGRRTLRQQRYTLLTFDAAGPECPPARPREVLDASVGLQPLDLELPTSLFHETTGRTTALRVDFYMGAERDRVIRVVSQYRDGLHRQQVDVLGHDPKTNKWGILASGKLDGDADAEMYASSMDGKYAVFGQPLRVLDITTLRVVPTAGILETIRQQHKKAEIWSDRKTKAYEAELGIATEFGPVKSVGQWGGKYYLWDAEKHDQVAWPAGVPRCLGTPVIVRDAKGERVLRVFDVAEGR